MKKKYTITLLEVMIVIFIIGSIGSVLGFNMRGSLDKGRAFKTKEALSKIYEIVQLQQAQGFSLDPTSQEALEKSVVECLKQSELVRKPSALIKDGWGITFHFDFDGEEFSISSAKYDAYCREKGIVDSNE